jgi:Cd(II)/Pb(II)-responsive transcriptional regulator
MTALETLKPLQSQAGTIEAAGGRVRRRSRAMKIGELASATQTPVETIRYYEREGLLPAAPRSDGNYRIHGPEHVERLAFIRHCRALDMTLDEIRVLLGVKDAAGEDCGDVNALLDAHIGHVAARIRGLRQLERQLKALREQCTGVHDAAHCGILTGLAQAAPLPPAETMVGVHGRSPIRTPRKTR